MRNMNIFFRQKTLHQALHIALLAFCVTVPSVALADEALSSRNAEPVAAAPTAPTDTAFPDTALPATTKSPAASSKVYPASGQINPAYAASGTLLSNSDPDLADSATPAPILTRDTSTPTATPPVDLWTRIRSGFSMSPLNSPQVASSVNWYAQRPDSMRRTIERSKMYLFHIMEQVQKRGMPSEIALLPIVESAFNPMAYSRSHASGIWQFIPSTGKDFGLKQNGWYDGRRDIVAATSAALNYLDKLHTMFGSWELALAAYNCGEGCVSRAIAKNQAAGLPTDYLSLKLPAETRDYVPKLMAVKEIIADPAMVGLSLSNIPNQAYFTKVSLQNPIDVKLAAKLANMPLTQFESLNPAYKKPIVRSDTPQQILLPVDKADAFATNLKNYDQPLVSWQAYPAKAGDSAAGIAKKFGVTLAWLNQHNEFSVTRKGKLTEDHTLLVPLENNLDAAQLVATTPQSENTKTIAKKEPLTVARARSVTVKRGETLVSLAKRHHVSLAELKRWNHLRSNKVQAGDELMIAAADAVERKGKQVEHKMPEAKPGKKIKHYTVKRGDTLFSIAQKFDVAVADIQRWNSMKHSATIKPGVKLALHEG
jgi:membrane-bound lytic murein transglycosylase D